MTVMKVFVYYLLRLHELSKSEFLKILCRNHSRIAFLFLSLRHIFCFGLFLSLFGVFSLFPKPCFYNELLSFLNEVRSSPYYFLGWNVLWGGFETWNHFGKAWLMALETEHNLSFCHSKAYKVFNCSLFPDKQGFLLEMHHFVLLAWIYVFLTWMRVFLTYFYFAVFTKSLFFLRYARQINVVFLQLDWLILIGYHLNL